MGLSFVITNGSGGGAQGAGIQNITYKSADQDGNFIYEFELTDGTKYDIKMPKGQQLDLSTVGTNEIIVKQDDDTLVGSGMFLSGDDLLTQHDILAKSLTVDPSTIRIGSVRLRENGGFLENIPDTSQKHYLMLDYENDKTNGTSKPIYWKRANRKNITVRPTDTTNMNNVTHLDYGNPLFDSEVQRISFNFINPVNNFRFKIIVNGHDVGYYPSQRAWSGLEAGYDVSAGINSLSMSPNFSFLKEYYVTFEFKADDPINLKGDGTYPWLTINCNEITRHEIALIDDLASIPTGGLADGTEVVAELSKLTGENRLPASAIKDIPTYDDSLLTHNIQVNRANIVTNQQDISDNLKEIQRIRTDIGEGDNPVPVFTGRFKGDVANIIPQDAVHRSYFISVYALDTDGEDIKMPNNILNIDEGAVFCIDNNAKKKSVNLVVEPGETIDGVQTINIPANSMAFLVKTGTGWTIAFRGTIPDSMGDIITQVKKAIPTPTTISIEEIQNQLKDRLHTFREIQNEFADQLHTFDAIEVDMVSKGFSKGASMAYGFVPDINSVEHDTTWVIAYIDPGTEVVIPPVNKGMQHLAVMIPSFMSSAVKEILINGAVAEHQDQDIVRNEVYWRALLTQQNFDTSKTNRFRVEWDTSIAGTVGIEIDDGTTNKAGVSKINVNGMYLDKVFDDSNEVTLKSVTSWETLDGMGGGRVNRVMIEPPLLSYLDPNVQPGEDSRLKLYIEHNHFELAKPPGYLAYLTENEEVLGRIKPNETGVRVGTIWFDDIIVGGNSPYISLDKPNKAIGIEDYTEDDPNVTGGIPTLIAYRIAMKGKAPNDGFVEILLRKTSEGTPTQDGDYLLDSNGQPIGIRHQYKAGDDLGVLDCMAIYMAKEQVKFQCLLEHNFADDGVMIEDRTEGASGIMIQALGKNYSTGDALLQFENDTMQNIEMTKHYNGEDIFNMAWALNHNIDDVDINAGVGQTSVDGFHFYNNTNLKIGIANKTMHIHDNGTDMVYFSLGQIFSAEKTYMLRGKDLDIKVTLQDKDQAFRIYMVKWTGAPDKYTDKIVSGYQNLNPIYETNWVQSGSIFISEDAISGEHDFAGTLTVPADANNFAVVIVPIVEQSPLDLYVKGFEVNVSEPFYGWILQAPELIGEKHLQYDERHAELRCDVAGYSEVRYTLNNVPAGMPMPIGVIKSGKADIEIDHTINQVSGSSLPQFEGAIKFNKEGRVTIQTDLYVHSEKAHDVLATTKFWYSKVSTDGNTFTKIPLSEYDVQVRGQTKAINHMPKFSIDVQPGDRIALFGTSDQADGAFIDTTETHVPMLKTVIDFEEITESEIDVIDRLNTLEQHADEILFVEDGKPVANPEDYKLQINVKTGQIEVVKA